jgi:hypothetical protein
MPYAGSLGGRVNGMRKTPYKKIRLLVTPTGIEPAPFDKLRMTRLPAALVEYRIILSCTGFCVFRSRLIPSNSGEYWEIRETAVRNY